MTCLALEKHKRIILCGPSCAGKNFIRDKFTRKGFKADVSYTSRAPRDGEVDGVDYQFISKDQFKGMIDDNLFYEWVQYGDNYYGTGLFEWEHSDIFIMETDGVSKILPIHRQECLVIFVNTPLLVRIIRMQERGWNEQKIGNRRIIDEANFGDFKDFDLQISSE